MAVDGQIDYRAFGDAQLAEALTRIDRAAFPVNHSHLVAEIERRRATRAAEAASVPPVPPTIAVQPEFRGDGREYFRIWIVNVALTIATIGVYSAWAKVRTLRYFYGRTTLAGAAFGYRGDAVAILKGRLLVAACLALAVAAFWYEPRIGFVLALVYLLALPWLYVTARVFALRTTAWGGAAFDFRADYAGAYLRYLGLVLLAVLSLGLALPYVARERYRFLVTRTIWAGRPFDCAPKVERFYVASWIGVLLAILLAIAVKIGSLAFTGLVGLVPEAVPVEALAQIVDRYGVFAVVLPVVGAYVRARNLNEVYSTTSWGPHRLRCALVPHEYVRIVMTNYALIALTLGLYAPWARVRMARYRVSSMQLLVAGRLEDALPAVSAPARGTGADAAADVLGVDLGL